jgi:hypothetical protein
MAGMVIQATAGAGRYQRVDLVYAPIVFALKGD